MRLAHVPATRARGPGRNERFFSKRLPRCCTLKGLKESDSNQSVKIFVSTHTLR